MDEPEFRRRLGEVDTNVNDNVNVNAVVDPAAAAKKTKRIPRFFTVSVDHSPIQVQVLSTQTTFTILLTLFAVTRRLVKANPSLVTSGTFVYQEIRRASLLLWRISFGIETSCSQSSTCGFGLGAECNDHGVALLLWRQFGIRYLLQGSA